jgi:MFS family permease
MPRNICVLYTFTFLNGFRPHWPISIVYFKEITGSYAVAMTAYSIVFCTQALMEVPAGIFSDGVQRRRTMIVGATCASLSIACYALGISFWVLLCGALFEGLSRALFSGTDNAVLFESLTVEDREKNLDHYLGRMNFMSQAALCASAALCAWLALYSLELVLWVSVIPQVLSLVSVLLLTKTSMAKNEGERLLDLLFEAIRNFKRNTRLKLLATAETLDFGIGESIFFYFQGAFFETLVPTWILGLARCANHLFGSIGFWFAGTVVRLCGARHTLVIGTTAHALIKIAAVLFASTGTPFAMAATNVIWGPTSTARAALLQQEFSDRQRATMGSMISLSGSVAFAVVSALLGVLAHTITPAVAIMVGLLGNTAIVLIYLRIFSDREHVPALVE